MGVLSVQGTLQEDTVTSNTMLNNNQKETMENSRVRSTLEMTLQYIRKPSTASQKVFFLLPKQRPNLTPHVFRLFPPVLHHQYRFSFRFCILMNQMHQIALVLGDISRNPSQKVAYSAIRLGSILIGDIAREYCSHMSVLRKSCRT
jgi:hypothetical protein